MIEAYRLARSGSSLVAMVLLGSTMSSGVAHAESGVAPDAAFDECSCNGQCGADRVCVMGSRGVRVCCPGDAHDSCPADPGPGTECVDPGDAGTTPVDPDAGSGFDAGESPPDAAVGPDAADSPPPTEPGGCSAAAPGHRGAWWAALALSALAGVFARRRRAAARHRRRR